MTYSLNAVRNQTGGYYHVSTGTYDFCHSVMLTCISQDNSPRLYTIQHYPEFNDLTIKQTYFNSVGEKVSFNHFKTLRLLMYKD